MSSFDDYLAGKHAAHAYVGMYFLERSTGLDIGVAPRDDLEAPPVSPESSKNVYSDGTRLASTSSGRRSRNAGYGYATVTQHSRAADAIRSASSLVSGYSP
jgi:hypothetical protein